MAKAPDYAEHKRDYITKAYLGKFGIHTIGIVNNAIHIGYTAVDQINYNSILKEIELDISPLKLVVHEDSNDTI